MEDENTKEENQPSTSRKESQRTNSGHEMYDDRGHAHDERASNTETSLSATYSARSRIDMADTRPEVPKQPLGKREPKAPARKKRGRIVGRVEKRRRSYTRRQVRRAPKRKQRPKEEAFRKDRELSLSTILTRLSSRSGSRTPGCIHCGHRCCRRRAKRFVVRYKKTRCEARRYPKSRKKKIMRVKRLKKGQVKKILSPKFSVGMSQEIQIGSRSQMLSPLFINTNSSPAEDHLVLPSQTYCEVTPEMIYESLRILTLWKQDVQTIMIMENIKRNYPVNPVDTELFSEMKEKLRIAAMIGIVVQTNEDNWCLNCELQNRKLTANHVTLFWQAYADTLSPIKMVNTKAVQKKLSERQTNTAGYKGRVADFSDDLI